MRKSHTAAMEIFAAKANGPVATEPYEAGWEREALAVIYCHKVHGPAPRLELHAQISADGVRWIDFGRTLPAISAPGGSFLSFEELERRFPRGADVVINTRGSMEFTELAFRLCAVGARLLCYGVASAGKTVPIEPHIIWRKEIQLIGGRSYNNTFGAALDLIDSRRLQVAPLVTRTVNLERYAEVVASPSGNHIKTVVVPDQPQAEQVR